MPMKYFDEVRKAAAEQKPLAALPPFDLERLRARTWKARIGSRMLENPRWLLALFRRFRPIGKVGPLYLVTRDADVRDVLERESEFQTPFGPEMIEMAGGSNFILGMQDGFAYREMKKACLTAFPVSEVDEKLRPMAARLASEATMRVEPGFNAVQELFKLVPARICRDYYGLAISDEEKFADWAIALSSLFFADFAGDRTTRDLAVVAADRMKREIDLSIAAVRAGKTDPETPLARLVRIHDESPGTLTEADIHSIMMGMVSGFVPTNLLAGGNCLDVILSIPEAQAAVEAAIAANDDKALDKAIREAMRFKPINIGPLRYVPQDAVVARGTRRERVIPAGSTIMPSTLSAMFDPDVVDEPEHYKLDRPDRNYLLFGHGIHWCIGSAIARVQIAESMRVLFGRANLRRAKGISGNLSRLGAFPEALHVDFDRDPEERITRHALVTVVAEVADGVGVTHLRDLAGRLGNPPAPEIQAALDASQAIHFSSLAIICKTNPAEERPDDKSYVVLEFSADGTEATAIAAMTTHGERFLRPVFEAAGALAPDGDFAAFLGEKAVPIGPGFSGLLGQGFSGTPGHSVKRIRQEAALYDDVQELVRSITASGPKQAAAIVADVRKQLSAKGGYDWALRPANSLLESTGSNSLVDAIKSAPESRKAIGWGLATLALFSVINQYFTFGWNGGFFTFLAQFLAAGVLSIAGTALVIVVFFLAIRAIFNRKEAEDPASDGLPDFPLYQAVVENENRYGNQNHLTGLSVMKPGRMRLLALRIVFFVIRFTAVNLFRPGYLGSINTIHFARWVLMPDNKRLVFFSNYGGSWESYLEDFITKAHQGLTGVWSNTCDYPRTRDLFFEGATDGDRFKRWARRQQIPTLFWYCAYPGLNTRRIRTNSAVRQGLVRADTESEAREWLANFGSLPAPSGILETPEIQSIFFGPMGKLDHANALMIAIPDGLAPAMRREWLKYVADRTSFGDQLRNVEAMICAFGPNGLARLGLEAGPDCNPIDEFPPAFRQGMHHPSRARILDDVGKNETALWEWGRSDRDSDAILVLYAVSREVLEKNLSDMRARTIAAGMSIVCEMPLSIRKNADGRAIEPFGFVDGISQPVIEGTPRGRAKADPLNMVAAGEFLLGYKDQRGYVPPAIALPAARDPQAMLPLPGNALRVSDPQANAPRDLGRNGSFLVVRHMEQHVKDFSDFCSMTAAALGTVDDRKISADWIGAKITGRWKDGSSLVRNPHGDKPVEVDNLPDNDFTFGEEDPQGMRCPLGSHVRRSNPRDSLGEDRETMLEIGKRHRILRVGRSYERAKTGGGKEEGLFFMCLNADIERQFEFVQQTWLAAAQFHGLRDEKDPIVGNFGEGGGTFTIPTPNGGIEFRGLPQFVTVRGGGYYFMPGRRTIRYLVSRLGE